MRQRRFGLPIPSKPALTAGDVLVLLALASLLFIGVRLARGAPASLAGPAISTAIGALPWYALLSVCRMAAAYILSLGFSIAYGYAAARHRSARTVLMPILDVLQSIPILSFLPVVLLSLSAILPERLATEMAAIMLIVTSQVWNMTFSFYQSMTTMPRELREAAAVFRFGPWLRFRTLELPFAAIGLIWNSMMSWAGGWFFLMAAEIFHVGSRDFRLAGLGSYLQTAANAGDARAIMAGLGTLLLIVVVMDQVIWRPLLAFSDRFKLEMVEGDEPPTSWFLDVMSRGWLVRFFRGRVWMPLLTRSEGRATERPVAPIESPDERPGRPSLPIMVFGAAIGALVLLGGFRSAKLLATLPMASWGRLAIGLLATSARVACSLAIALAWTVPVGVAIGMNRRLAAVFQPIVQIAASVPATAIFPVLVVLLLRIPGGLNLSAILLMLLGTQWYLLFNVIAGAAAIPNDLRYTTDLLQLSRGDRWRTLILPALFPYIVTGAITASGGAWNASIIAEHVSFAGRQMATIGIGSAIAEATGEGNYALLMAGTLAMIVTVALINRTVWRRLYRLAETRYTME